MTSLGHRITLAQTVIVAAAGAIASSAVAAAAVAGLFAVVNTIVNLTFENRRAVERRRRIRTPIFMRSVERRSLLPYYINGLTAVVSTAALLIAVSQISAIQQSRARSATDTCYLFRAVVLKASIAQHHKTRGERFLNSVKLGNCQQYGRTLTSIK